MARGRVRKIDNLIWDTSTGSGLGLAAGSDVGVLWGTAGTAPSTLLRIRGNFRTWLAGTIAPGPVNVIQAGIILVPEGSGTTLRYSPASDPNAPWLWFMSAVLGYEESVTDVIDVAGLQMHNEVVDNKAMRRVRPDVELQMGVSNTALSGSQAIDFAYAMRFLQGF